MINFALSFASGNVYNVNNLDSYSKLKSDKPWLFIYCLSNSVDSEEELNHELNCLDEMSIRKLAIMLHGLVNVANVDCTSKTNDDLCTKLAPKPSAPILYYYSLPSLDTNQPKSVFISFSDHNKIYQQVLTLLPDNNVLEENELQVKFKIK